MSSPSKKSLCDQAARVSLYALRVLPAADVDAMEVHIDGCLDCRHQMARLRPVVDSFGHWPTDILRPPESLWEHLEQSLGSSSAHNEVRARAASWKDAPWQEAAPGLTYKGLSVDREHNRLTLLVRLAAGVEYPPHRHGGVEELHLLDGELFVDGRKLRPGDYNRAEPGTSDHRVWTETGCTCVLITSSSDVLL